MVRVFQFKNTIFSNQVYSVHGEYCVIGYFDALDMHVENNNSDSYAEWLNVPDRQYILDHEELGDLYTINGIRQGELDQKRDEEFWKAAEKSLVFISCVRFKRSDPDLLEKIRKIEKNEQTVVYTTLDSSDVLICHRSTSYALGHDFLMKAQNDFCRDNIGDCKNMLICFSVIAVKQTFLDEMAKKSEEQWGEGETVNCIHRCIVRDRDQSYAFFHALSEDEKLHEENPNIQIFCRETIGTDDMIIHIDNISLKYWLILFASNKYFTHEYYGCAFFNIQSTILHKTLISSNNTLKKPKDGKLVEINSLKDLLNECEMQHENALKQCCERMIRLEWAYQKINNNDLVAYLSKMLLHVFPMSKKYFAERVEACLVSSKKEDRIEYEDILFDIQKSVTRIWEAEDSILHSTNAADRIVIQTAPVDTGLRYVSPKLCYYYSEMLRELSNLLKEDEVVGDYGFLVSPSVSNETVAEVLFSTNPQHGKVCLISVPENMIADVRRVRMLLLHEFFHINPVGLRQRKSRALHFLRVLLYDVETILFSGLEFNSQQENEKLRVLLTKCLIDQARESIGGLNEDSRMFYGCYLMGFYADIFKESTKGWITINLKEILCSLGGENERDFDNYRLKHERALVVTEKIHANALLLLLTNRVERICELYMDLFREPLCDIFTVLTEYADPERYIGLFKTEHSGAGGWNTRLPLLYRVYFVIEAMTAPLPDELNTIEPEAEQRTEDFKALIASWQQWRSSMMNYTEKDSLEASVSELIREIKELKMKPWSYQIEELINYNEQSSSKEDFNFSFMMNKSSVDEYLQYFCGCRNAYIRLQLMKMERFDNYRRKFGLPGEADNTAIIEKISLRLWEIEGGEKGT